MHRIHFPAAALAVSCLSLCSSASAETARETFDSLYGQRLRQVRTTPSTADDLELAREMLQGTGMKLSPELIALLCDEAYQLAGKLPHGHKEAEQALRLLARTDPARRHECQEKLLPIYQARYNAATKSARPAAGLRLLGQLVRVADSYVSAGRAGEAMGLYRRAQLMDRAFRGGRSAELIARVRRAILVKNIDGKLALARAKLKKDPEDIAARTEIIRLYVVELDRPQLALPWADKHADEIQRTYVPLACKPPAEVPAAVSMELARWYDALADKAVNLGRAHALSRARVYYQRYAEVAEVNEAGGMQRLKATMALVRIDKELKKLADAGFALAAGGADWPGNRKALVFLWSDGRTRDPLGKVKPRGSAKLTPDGAMTLRGGAFLATDASARLLAACRKSNQLTVEAVITPANIIQDGPARIISFSQDGSARNFTVGQSAGSLNIRIRTPATGANGSIAQGNVCRLQAGKPHHVIVSYAPGKLAVFLNGKPVHTSQAVKGDLSNWQPMQLLFGDEYRDPRDWAGQLKYIALYSRTIGPEEAKRKFAALAGKLKKGT